jgi:hypothetical protein
VFPTSATSWKVMLLSLLSPPCSPPIVYSTIAASGSWGVLVLGYVARDLVMHLV